MWAPSSTQTRSSSMTQTSTPAWTPALKSGVTKWGAPRTFTYTGDLINYTEIRLWSYKVRSWWWASWSDFLFFCLSVSDQVGKWQFNWRKTAKKWHQGAYKRSGCTGYWLQFSFPNTGKVNPEICSNLDFILLEFKFTRTIKELTCCCISVVDNPRPPGSRGDFRGEGGGVCSASSGAIGLWSDFS